MKQTIIYFILERVRWLGYWCFCKIGNPIWSPSQSILQNKGNGKFLCMHCGKHHGTLPQQQEYYYKKLRQLLRPVRDTDIMRGDGKIYEQDKESWDELST